MTTLPISEQLDKQYFLFSIPPKDIFIRDSSVAILNSINLGDVFHTGSFSWLSCPFLVCPSHLYFGILEKDFCSCFENLADLQNKPPAWSFSFVSYVSPAVWTNILSLIVLKQVPNWWETTYCWISRLCQKGDSSLLSCCAQSDQTRLRANRNCRQQESKDLTSHTR